jgi:AcrR family transcriptional regulator
MPRNDCKRCAAQTLGESHRIGSARCAAPAEAAARRRAHNPAGACAVALKRDADQTRARILRAARNEFMRHGYSGARVERISRAARSSDRMIYYYFASKERLYIEVLEGVYTDLGAAEGRLELDVAQPDAALRTLIEFTWEYYLNHPEFVALLSNENLQRGRHITKSLRVKQLSRPVLDILARILDEGMRQRVFRAGLDVKQVYLSIAALGYFYLSNRYTLSSFLGDDFMQRERRDAWLAEITRIVLASVRADPAAPATPTFSRSVPGKPAAATSTLRAHSHGTR